MTITHHRPSLLVALLLGGCLRTAGDYEGIPSEEELDELRLGACEALCETTDRCDPHRFDQVEPSDCFTRCMTLMPLIYEVNQCGSREMLWMYCVGDQTCDEYENWDLSVNRQDFSGTPCAEEVGRAHDCDEDLRFDMNEYGPFDP